ncbi:hypothetical protein PGTUg99_004453 [Puccinia graminis f. sp. tritici]|uniref:Secreted protein n=1 Tax=Puccinia graminis f. sp. tritici TaxID=56615 RepID=A0A5B0RAX7_PUCGR|nr:hypothetical protein PGTUg99_004453 [Puccinia graminis f. sp. tritici]
MEDICIFPKTNDQKREALWGPSRAAPSPSCSQPTATPSSQSLLHLKTVASFRLLQGSRTSLSLMMNFLQKRLHVGWAFLPLAIVLHSDQVARVEGGEVCDARFESSMNSIAYCWSDENTKFNCVKTGCTTWLVNGGQPFGSLAFSGCVNKFGQVKPGLIHPSDYHHYPGAKQPYVAAYDPITQRWYNCPYASDLRNYGRYSCSTCYR